MKYVLSIFSIKILSQIKRDFCNLDNYYKYINNEKYYEI
jgi:hypothetical protein